MQVSCTNCSATYEFDVSAIPAAGYDAQCTTCQSIFFVSPHSDQPARPLRPPEGLSPSPATTQANPRTAAQVAIACEHCGAVYQFSAADIPQAGYDAQCTQCQGVFFVSPDGATPVVEPGATASGSGAGAQVADAAAAPFAPNPEAAEVAEPDFASLSQVIALERAAEPEASAAGDLAAMAASPPVLTAGDDVVMGEFSDDAPALDFHDGAHPREADPILPTIGEAAPAAAPALPAQSLADMVYDSPAFESAGPVQLGHPGTSEPSAPVGTPLPPSPDTQRKPNRQPEGAGQRPEIARAEPAAPTTSAKPAADGPQTPSRAHLALRDLAPGQLDADGHEAERAQQRRRRLWTTACAIAATLATVAAGIGLFGLPRSRPQTPAVVATAPMAKLADAVATSSSRARDAALNAGAMPSPAQEAFMRGMVSLLQDTNKGLAGARDAFRQALKSDAQMVDAYAGLALHSLLAGEDLLASGQQEWTEVSKRQPEVLALQARLGQGGRVRRGSAKELERERLRLVELSAQVNTLRERAMLHVRTGAQWLQDGALLLWRGNGQGIRTPFYGAVASLWLSSDPYLAVPGDDDAALAAARLQYADAARALGVGPGGQAEAAADRSAGGGPNAPAPAASSAAATPGFTPVAEDAWALPWLALAKARILAATPAMAPQTTPTLEAAIAHEPRFVRGRWEMARRLEQNGQTATAQRAATAILSYVPTHEKARALLERLRAPVRGRGSATMAAGSASRDSKAHSRGGKKGR